MIKVGIIMNIIGVVLITTFMYVVGLVVFGIELGVMPPWVTG